MLVSRFSCEPPREINKDYSDTISAFKTHTFLVSTLAANPGIIGVQMMIKESSQA